MSTKNNSDILEELHGGIVPAPRSEDELLAKPRRKAKAAEKEEASAKADDPSDTPEFAFTEGSLEGGKRRIESGILAAARLQLLELAIALEKGKVTEQVIKETQASLQKIVAEMGRSKGKDEIFNYPLLDNVGRVVFDDLPLVFGKDAQVESALKVLQKVFRQRYNAVVVVDAQRRSVGIIPSAVLINSDPEVTLGEIPTVTQNFSVTLETKSEDVTAIMDRLGVNVLPVVDAGGYVIGTFTSRDHVKGVAALYGRRLKESLETHVKLADIQKDMENPLS